MSEQKSELQQMTPYLIVSGALLLLILAVVFWPSSEPESSGTLPTMIESMPQVSSLPADAAEPTSEAPEVFEAPKLPNAVVIGEDAGAPEVLEPIIEASDDFSSESFTISDQVVKTAIVTAVKSEAIRSLLVDDALLQRFVINVYDVANQEITLKDNILRPPNAPFATYQQADRLWIDNASYQRYSPYLAALENLDAKALVDVYESYKPQLIDMFSEISRPSETLDSSLVEAIDELLDTPELEYPLEVLVETVMYRFADPIIEGLSSPQKQMIRMGPDNMKRFKAILEDIKLELESRNTTN